MADSTTYDPTTDPTQVSDPSSSYYDFTSPFYDPNLDPSATGSNSSQGSSSSAGNANNTAAYVSDAIKGLGSVTSIIGDFTGNKPNPAPAAKSVAQSSTTNYFIIGTVVVIVICIAAYIGLKD